MLELIFPCFLNTNLTTLNNIGNFDGNIAKANAVQTYALSFRLSECRFIYIVLQKTIDGTRHQLQPTMLPIDTLDYGNEYDISYNDADGFNAVVSFIAIDDTTIHVPYIKNVDVMYFCGVK